LATERFDLYDPICVRCSKPIRPGTGIPTGGRRVHVRCLAEDTRLQSIEQQDRASRESARAKSLLKQARETMAKPGAAADTCSACGRSLKNGRSLLFQGDDLVHALCWHSIPTPDELGGGQTSAD